MYMQKYYGKISPDGVIYILKNYNFLYENLLEFLPLIPKTYADCKREKNKKLFEIKCDLESKGFIEKGSSKHIKKSPHWGFFLF